MSVGQHLGTSKTQDYVLLAGLALVGYVLYKVFGAVSTVASGVGSAVSAVGGALTNTGEAIGSGLYDLVHPNELGSMDYLVVSFPDGKHAVPADSVNANGLFTWTGYPAGSQSPQVLTLVKDKATPPNYYATAES